MEKIPKETSLPVKTVPMHRPEDRVGDVVEQVPEDKVADWKAAGWAVKADDE